MNKLVSIITPSFNSSRFIDSCIDSVLNQDYKDWEMLIVDDCSQDNSREIILSYAKRDHRIKYFFLEKNIGAAEARNVAIRAAKGRYIAFLDSDDMWYFNKLSHQIQIMRKCNFAFTFTSYDVIQEENTNIINTINVPSKIGYHGYLKNTIIGCLTVILDKEETGDFEMPNINSSHDMALWLLIMRRGITAHGINLSLSKYRLLSSSNTANKFKAAKDVWLVYREIEKLNFIYSAICFIFYTFNAIRKRI